MKRIIASFLILCIGLVGVDVHFNESRASLKAVAGFNQAAVAITGGSITGTNAPYMLSKSAIPFIHVSSGSIGNNGALTGITALPLTYSGGAYVYYPANSIAAGVGAGWYWTVFSSTTAGTIYNSTYTSGTPANGTLTAFATTGPGAFTGDTTERAGPTITLPANAMGPSGQIRVLTTWQVTNNANNKPSRVRFGGAAGTAYLSQNFASVQTAAHETYIANRGASLQIGPPNLTAAFGTATTGLATSTVDTTASTTIVLSVGKATATDNQVLEQYAIQVAYGA